MGNMADLIVVIVIGLSAFIGYKKGFVKVGLGFLAFFIAVALTFIFYQPVMHLIQENTDFEVWFTAYLEQKSFGNEATEEEAIQPGEQEEMEASYMRQLPNSVVEWLGLTEFKENAKNAIIQKIVHFVTKLLAIVIVYIVARIALWILILVLDLIAKLPVLKQFNEVMGLAFGVLLGLIKIYGAFAVVALMGSFSLMNWLTEAINGSVIASFLYHHNILLEILF